MRSLALAVVGAALLATPAGAFEIGRVVSFNKPYPVAAGCTQMRDAIQVHRMSLQDNDIGIADFVDWVGFNYSSDPKQVRVCDILNRTAATSSYKVVDKLPGNYGRVWLCLSGPPSHDPRVPVDLGTVTIPCLWISVRDNAR